MSSVRLEYIMPDLFISCTVLYELQFCIDNLYRSGTSESVVTHKVGRTRVHDNPSFFSRRSTAHLTQRLDHTLSTRDSNERLPLLYLPLPFILDVVLACPHIVLLAS
jgi:hypothetical protein